MAALEPLTSCEVRKTVGITTTVPIEIIFAAGLRPLDLNNAFITSGCAAKLIESAEQLGFPRNSCAWSKGVYAAARALGLKQVAAVVQGDCANTHAIAERLAADGVKIVPFVFPYTPDDEEIMCLSLKRFANSFDAAPSAARHWKKKLDDARALAQKIDELCWKKDRVTGEEQHFWTISCSDFSGDIERFEEGAEKIIAAAYARSPLRSSLRLGLIGIPPICNGFFDFLEGHGARVVFNEIPRQFSMPFKTKSLAEQYSRYTYPYDIFHRLKDIRRELVRRRANGVIHYIQSFCYRQTQDAIVRRELELPILTLECDRPGPLDLRTETRIEAFLEMLSESF